MTCSIPIPGQDLCLFGAIKRPHLLCVKYASSVCGILCAPPIRVRVGVGLKLGLVGGVLRVRLVPVVSTAPIAAPFSLLDLVICDLLTLFDPWVSGG